MKMYVPPHLPLPHHRPADPLSARRWHLSARSSTPCSAFTWQISWGTATSAWVGNPWRSSSVLTPFSYCLHLIFCFSSTLPPRIPMQCGLCPIFELVQWPVYLLVIYISMSFLVSQGATRHHTQGQLRLFKGEVRSSWEGWESCGCNR